MTTEFDKPIKFIDQELSTMESFWTVRLYVTQLQNGLFRAEIEGDKVICEVDACWQDEDGEWNLPSHIDGKEIYRVDEDYDGKHVVIGDQTDVIEFTGVDDDTFWMWLAQTDFYDERFQSEIRERWKSEFAAQS